MHDTPDFRTEFKIVSPELVDVLPKVVLNFEGPLSALQGERVAYVEWIVDFAQLDEALAEASAEESKTVTLIVRCSSVAEVEKVIGRHPAIVGVAASGDEDAVAPVVAAAQKAWMPYVVEGDPAFEALTPRVSHSVALFDDFVIAEDGDIVPGEVSAWIRDRGVPIVCDPYAELAEGGIEALADHPLPMLRSLGFKATAAKMTTESLFELVETLELSLEDLYEMTMEAIEASFLPKPLITKLVDEQIYPVFEELSSVPNAATPDSHDHDHDHNSDDDDDDDDYDEDYEPNSEPIEPLDASQVDPAMLEELGIDPDVIFGKADQESEK